MLCTMKYYNNSMNPYLGYSCMSYYIVWACRFLYPMGFVRGQFLHPINCFFHIPYLVGIHTLREREIKRERECVCERATSVQKLSLLSMGSRDGILGGPVCNESKCIHHGVFGVIKQHTLSVSFRKHNYMHIFVNRCNIYLGIEDRWDLCNGYLFSVITLITTNKATHH